MTRAGGKAIARRLLFAFLAAFLLAFLLLPLATLLFSATGQAGGADVAAPIRVFFDNPLYIESLANSVGVALGASILAALAALPVAMTLWRFALQPPLIIELFGFLPLFVPPFMLSLSLQSLLGRGGGLGLLLQSWGDLDPSLGGLLSLALIEAVHHFPLVLVLLVLSTTAFAEQADEAARLGSSWRRLMTRVFLPLALPGLAFGMAITFLKTLDDLATPLSLGITKLLAPQAYFRVSTYGADDPLSSLMSIAMIAVSALVWVLSASCVQHEIARGNAAPAKRPIRLSPAQRAVGRGCLGAILAFYLLCYSGMMLSSIAGIWSHTPLPESYLGAHYASALQSETGSFANTLVYCGLAALIDVIIGLLMAYAIGQAPARWKKRLSLAVAGLLSVPAVALAIAYLQFFHGMLLPGFAKPLDATWFVLPMAFAVRGLPFAIGACSFALQQLPASTVDAARLSAASRVAIFTRIILPTMAFGLLIALLICFGIAAVDLSSAMLLVPSETDAPVSYNIYLLMQSSTGRGVGSALALLAIALVALAMTALALVMRRKPASGLRRILLNGSPTN